MNHLAVAHEHGPFEGVLQLADVAGPVIAREHVDRGRGDPADVTVMFLREFFEEVVDEQQEIGLSLAQRRHEHGEHVEAVVEVFAEGAGRDRALEVLVGRGDQPYVGLDRFGAAHTLELALLQDAQQLHLRGEVDVANLVEEQRPAVGELEAAFLPRLGAGKRALLVAEQLRFDQAFGQRGTAHFDERLLRAQGAVVNGVRDQLLAGT